MSLSKFLQSPSVLEEIRNKDFHTIKNIILQKGRHWYQNHPEEEDLIIGNLSALGKKKDTDLVEAVKEGILIHYAEKIMALSCAPSTFSHFIDDNIDYSDALKTLQSCTEDKGILMATPHFGGVEFATPTLAKMGYTTNVVLKFTTPDLSRKIRSYAREMEESADFSRINFIELGKKETAGALDMYAALRRKELLFTVFDEETEYSTEVELFGKRILGGAGIDKIIKPARAFIKVFTLFMVRTGDTTYRLEIHPIDESSKTPAQDMYRTLENVLSTHLEQWYFLHEEVPVVK